MTKKIKSITVYRQNANGPSLESDQEVLMSKEVYHPDFDKPVLQEQYGMDGALEQITVSEYDEKGFLIREVLKEADGSIMEEKSFEPDDKMRVAHKHLHYADGSRDTTTFTYDDNGKIVRKQTADSDGDIEEVSEMSYQEGQLVHQVVKDFDDEVIEEHRYIYEDGLLQEAHHFSAQENSSQKRVYDYNEKGHRQSVLVYDEEDNLVERFLFDNDDEGRPVKIIEENRQKKNTTHMRYEKQGNVGFQETYDLKGNLVSRIERVYSEDGRLLESRIETTLPAMGVQQNYIVKQQYEFFKPFNR